ncbi:MAG: hypothetical protein NUV90_01025 [Candidatus Parcubacteria bacterium]|nr:hypothetical protein [Candidatus Parcubacteria bacterium]
MYMYFVPVGRPEITVGILSRTEARQNGFRRTSVKNAAFVPPGGVFMASADNCPIIIATAGSEMMVAHVRRHSATISKVINSIIKAMERKAPRHQIVMCMQFGSKALESAFLERARRSRILHSWAMLSLDGFPALVRARKCNDDPDQWSLIRIKHDA